MVNTRFRAAARGLAWKHQNVRRPMIRADCRLDSTRSLDVSRKG